MSRKITHHVLSACGATAVAIVALVIGPAVDASAASGGPLSDVHSIGSITLYDHSGHVLTGGSTTAPLNSEIAKAVASGPVPKGYRDAVELDMWTPQDGTDPSQWNGGPLRGDNQDMITAQDANAPAVVKSISDWTLAKDVVLASGPSMGSYANRYQLRMIGIANGPEDAPTYYTATIAIDPVHSTWHVVTASASTGGFPGGPVAGGVGGLVIIGLSLWWRRQRHVAEPVASSASEQSRASATSTP